MKVLGQPEVYFNASAGLGEDGQANESSEAFLKGYAQAFAEHVRTA